MKEHIMGIEWGILGLSLVAVSAVGIYGVGVLLYEIYRWSLGKNISSP